jgi:predicted phosphohydrolase
MHDRLTVPDGDVLLHSGDFCGAGSVKEARSFGAFFRSLPHAHKVVIAGNHDGCLEADPTLAEEIFAGCHYLFDSGAEVAGLSMWGAPWQPWFLDWAFNLPRGEPLREKWSRIPSGLDVLLTHGPPFGVLDTTARGDRVGCEELLVAVDRARPRIHVFGHIHEGYGVERRSATLHVNASTCTVAYQPTNAAIVIDLPPSGDPLLVT